MKKLLIITSIYPNASNPTSGTFVHELNLRLKNIGYDISVIHIKDIGYRGWFNNDFRNILIRRHENINVYEINYRAIMTQRLPRLNYYNYKKKLDKVLLKYFEEEGKPDLIINQFSFLPAIVYSGLITKYNVPYITIEHHSLYLKNNLSPFIVKMLNRAYDNSESFIVVSNILYKNIRELIKDDKKMKIVPNLISPIYKYEPPQEVGGFRFLSVGSLIPSKNHELVIRAFINEFSIEEEVYLCIVGRGPEYQNLVDIITVNNRSHQIKLIKGLSPKELAKQYQKSNAFILVSQFETFGIVYREATAVGRPIIASDTDGIREYWDDSLGYLLNDLNHEEVAKAMRNMVNSYNRFDYKFISQYTQERYNFDKTINQLVDEIEKSANN